MRVLDLFSGIGGFSYGLEMASKEFKTTKFCEIDKFCQKVLKKHWPNVPIHDDIKTLSCTENEFDIICGGFPCQDISVAGQKKGITNETRSGLWYEYKRIIKEVKPRYVIIENVRNLLNNGFAIVLKDLHEIGLDAEWEIISARSVGACHLRERLWIVAYPNAFKLRQQSRGSSGTQGESKVLIGELSSNGFPEPTYSDNFRFWPSFATEEEKSEWWAKATSSFRDWWEAESSVCRVDDGVFEESYENIGVGMDRNRMNIIIEMLKLGRIEVNQELGHIYSTAIRGNCGNKTLLSGSNLNGYIVHSFRFKNKKIIIKAHQIIWISKNGIFDGDKFVIDHINRDRSDNRISNLRLTTFKGNYENQDRSHLSTPKEVVDKILNLYSEEFTIREIAEITEYSKSRVHQILQENYSKLDKDRVSRIKALGNSIVPQIVKIIGERIYDKTEKQTNKTQEASY